ncbi:hypothetical protein MCOR21_002611 [Pyricularia oryzae]|nr:hypothetical protein MCOR21_002611 [Pyricularia oryzae]
MSVWLMTVTTFLGGMAGPEQDRVEPVYAGAERVLSLGNSGRKSPKVFQLQFGLEYSFTHEKL